jgi:hypothetical protein
VTHKVGKGESVDDIAVRFCVTVRQLMRRNNMSKRDSIQYYAVLYIPALQSATPAGSSRAAAQSGNEAAGDDLPEAGLAAEGTLKAEPENAAAALPSSRSACDRQGESWYPVITGDTLSDIAGRYCVRVPALIARNVARLPTSPDADNPLALSGVTDLTIPLPAVA